MKKLGLLIMPLMAVSLLASCGQSKPQVAEHFVTFESYGGTHIDTQRVKDGETATPPEVTPTRGDDTFLGWFTDFEKQYTFTEVVTDDITLYAGWDVAPDPKTSHHFKFTGTDCTMNGSDVYECDITIGAQTQFAISVDSRHSLPTNIEIVKGENVTYEASTGLVKIANMSSDIEIKATGIAKDYFKFHFVGTNCTINGKPEYLQKDILKGSNLEFTISVEDRYTLPTSLEFEAGESCTTYQNGIITVSDISSDVIIKASGVPIDYFKFDFTGTNCTINGEGHFVQENIKKGSNLKFTILPNQGYILPESIEIPEDIKSFTSYKDGVISINGMTANVTLTVSIGDATNYHFTFEGTNCKMNNLYKVEEDISSSAVTQRSIQVDEGYDLSKLNVTITGDGSSKVTYGNGVVSINKLNGNVKVTASTSLKECTVTFDPNGGTRTGSETAKVSYNSKYSDISNKPTATLEACDFLGWGLTATDTKPVSDDYQIKDNITLYAVFKPTAYTEITFSSESSNCKLLYDGYEYSPSGKFNIPAGRETTISVVPSSGYVQVFKENMFITGADVISSFDPVKQEIKVKANIGSNCVIKASSTVEKKDSLDEYTWGEISQISENGLADKLFKVYKSGEDSKLSTKKLQMPYQDKNDNKVIDAGEVYQTVRIIGFNHDELTADRTKTAGITFEFVDSLCDADGYSIATPWCWTSGESTINHNYLNSNLRKAFDGGGSAALCWYEKGAYEPSTTFTTSIFDMLPSNSDPNNPGLKEVLKEVNKPIAIYDENVQDYVVNETDYNTKIFPLSATEMTEDPEIYELDLFEVEGEIYECYKGKLSGSDESRIKHQIKWHDGAREFGVVLEQLEWQPYNNAGVNPVEQEYGYNYLGRSPGVSDDNLGLCVGDNGFIFERGIWAEAEPVAPAFCI